MISRQATAMRIAARFLEELWSEIWPATVYLYNRIPRKATNWKSPLKIHNIWLRKHGENMSFQNNLPNLVYLYTYGCRAYPLAETWLKNIDRAAQKNWPRADLRYLIGYLGNNLYRI